MLYGGLSSELTLEKFCQPRRIPAWGCWFFRMCSRRIAARSSWTCSVCVVVCCSVLQCVAVCCSVLQCVAVCCSVLQWAAVCCSICGGAGLPHTAHGRALCVLQSVEECCSVLQCVAMYCIVCGVWLCRIATRSSFMCSVCVVVCCSVLQCVAECCGVS